MLGFDKPLEKLTRCLSMLHMQGTFQIGNGNLVWVVEDCSYWEGKEKDIEEKEAD